MKPQDNKIPQAIQVQGFRKCPACTTYKHLSFFATAMSYSKDLEYCDQCLAYITAAYGEYTDTVLKHTGAPPLNSNTDKDSSVFFAAYRYFTYHIDAHTFPDLGISSMAAPSALLDAPLSSETGRPVIAVHQPTGQCIEFDGVQAAGFFLKDSTIFIRSQCLMRSIQREDPLSCSDILDDPVLQPSEFSGYIYMFKHVPYDSLKIEARASAHVEAAQKALDADFDDELDIFMDELDEFKSTFRSSKDFDIEEEGFEDDGSLDDYLDEDGEEVD